MPRLFTIPAEAPFLPTLAEALLAGRLIPGFPGPGPLALADATIYLPTQRAVRAFGQALAQLGGAKSLALPRITPLGAFADDDAFEALDEPPVVGDLERRMTLARLVAEWGRALKGAIRRCGPDGRLIVDETEAPLVAATPAQALRLAGDLAALIDDMRIEGVAFERLHTLVADPFDAYWRITLDFLKVAFEAWPAWLTEKGLSDRAERQQRAVEREIAALEAGRRGPTIVAGSTGVNAATAKLIAAVARFPQGAVVLAGLDQTLDEAAWRLIAAKLEEGGDPTAATHPQAMLAKLLQRIGVAREDVLALGPTGPRARFLSEAMRPAESTHLWTRTAIEARLGLEGVALIEAGHEAEEALAIAVALRETLETPGRTAALITPAPAIARRVAAELTRWGIDVENSAGATLGATEEGALARLTLAAAQEFTPARVAALLASPRMRLGRSAEDYAAAARALELGVLRAPLPVSGLEDAEAAFAAAREAAASPYAHRAVATLSPDDFAAAQALLADLAAALAPLVEADGGPLAGLIVAHARTLAALAGEPGETVGELLDEWALAAGEGFLCGLGDYAAMFETLVAERAPPNPRGHPRLAVLGLLEARLLGFDRIILAGLDETIWPPAAETDAFLNRQLRADLGLSPPERRIGQTAQDFVAALGTADAILTRSGKRAGSPTVASRFLRRIEALAGPQELARLRGRGARYLDLARYLDRPTPSPPASRPTPKPALELRPVRLSVTRIETLRRDPYQIYAQYVLELKPLPPVGPGLTAAALGDVWHDLLETYAKHPPYTRERLGALAEAAFAGLNADPVFRALRWPRAAKALDVFFGFDEARREQAERIWLEAEGRLVLPLTDGSTFTLTARADRIELGRNGLATVIDYKTGAPPGLNEVRVGFAPQLTLEAAMLKAGAFAGVGELETEGGYYLKLGGAEGGEARALTFKDASFGEVAAEHLAGLKKMLDGFRNFDIGYMSRPSPKFVAKGTDYDHLARVAEWALGEGDEP